MHGLRVAALNATLGTVWPETRDIRPMTRRHIHNVNPLLATKGLTIAALLYFLMRTRTQYLTRTKYTRETLEVMLG